MRKIILIIWLLLLPCHVSATLDPLTDSEMANVTGQAGIVWLIDGIVDFGFAEAFNGEKQQEREEAKEIILGIPEKYTDMLNAAANLNEIFIRLKDEIVKPGNSGTRYIGGMAHGYIGILHLTVDSPYYEEINQVVHESSSFVLGY